MKTPRFAFLIVCTCPALALELHVSPTGDDSNPGTTDKPLASLHKDIRFVENIFEELDAPKEWFLNPKANNYPADCLANSSRAAPRTASSAGSSEPSARRTRR